MDVMIRVALPILFTVSAFAQPTAPPPPAKKAPPTEVAGIHVNYDEDKVGSYTIPDPLKLNNGKPVRDAKTWTAQRRPELLKIFEENQYGRAPGRPAKMHFEVSEKSASALDGRATRRQVTIYFDAGNDAPHMDLLVYLPAGATKPVPMLLNLGFGANAASVDDPGIKLGEIWNPREKKKVPATRAGIFGRTNIQPLLAKGFGWATFYYGDIEPDFIGGTGMGIRKTDLTPDEWGAISAWAWGVSRAIDYFETDHDVDAHRIAIMGVSRLGKTVMWEGAHDTRVAAVIASCSGEGGAALSRRIYGETIAHLVAPTRYPYQFAANYQKWANDPREAPVDAHELIALIAPRPVLLQTGSEDGWSDPKGEFLAAVAAEPVYKLLGKQGLGTTEWPAAGTPILHDISYYMHAGGHGTIPSDWDIFIKFLQAHLQ
jgi:hypothetical protein